MRGSKNVRARREMPRRDRGDASSGVAPPRPKPAPSDLDGV